MYPELRKIKQNTYFTFFRLRRTCTILHFTITASMNYVLKSTTYHPRITLIYELRVHNDYISVGPLSNTNDQSSRTNMFGFLNVNVDVAASNINSTVVGVPSCLANS